MKHPGIKGWSSALRNSRPSNTSWSSQASPTKTRAQAILEMPRGHAIYFGTYSLSMGYPRNRLIIQGLEELGWEVSQCHEPIFATNEQKLAAVSSAQGTLEAAITLGRSWIRLASRFGRTPSADLILVGYPGHLDAFEARALMRLSCRHRPTPLVLDAFLSPYDTLVHDRGVLRRRSLTARALFAIEKRAYRLSDIVLVDTQENADYLAELFEVTSSKFCPVPVGSIFQDSHSSRPCSRDETDVLFVGTYIPLHGVEHVLEAARILMGRRDIRFTLVGKGQQLDAMRRRSAGCANVTFIDRLVTPTELERLHSQADICLGIFGETSKASRVVPCKAFDALALGKPVITSNSPASQRLLSGCEGVVLTDAGSPESIAREIQRLADHRVVREKMGASSRSFFVKHFSRIAIAERVLGRVQRNWTERSAA